tara:strand:+ start:30 stop:182 length:153 start_codon:yes stop_codon:yes gene_type:complete
MASGIDHEQLKLLRQLLDLQLRQTKALEAIAQRIEEATLYEGWVNVKLKK